MHTKDQNVQPRHEQPGREADLPGPHTSRQQTARRNTSTTALIMRTAVAPAPPMAALQRPLLRRGGFPS